METKEQEPKEEVDDKGVPLINRKKEMERITEKYERELAATRQELQELKTSLHKEAPPENIEKMTQTDLMEFVKVGPTNFVSRKWQEFKTQDELGQVLPWVASQKGYKEEDKARLMAIETEYGLGHPSPLERAKSAWKILQQEKIANKTTSQNDDEDREARVNQSSTEGSGKSTPKNLPVTRRDLIKKLAKAEAEGDLDAAIRLTGILEDVRE